MTSAQRGLGTVAFLLGGMFSFAVAAIDAEPLWVPVGLACSMFGAAVEIDARGPLPRRELFVRAFGVAVVIVVTGGISLATAVLSNLGLLEAFAAFWLGWLSLVIRPVRRLLNPRGRSPIVSER